MGLSQVPHRAHPTTVPPRPARPPLRCAVGPADFAAEHWPHGLPWTTTIPDTKGPVSTPLLAVRVCPASLKGWLYLDTLYTFHIV